MEKFFKLKEQGTNISTEVMAGVTTFFAMSYILFVNPSILSASGMPFQAVFLATIIASVIGTLVMGLFANVPYAQAPGMINSNVKNMCNSFDDERWYSLKYFHRSNSGDLLGFTSFLINFISYTVTYNYR